MREIMKKSLAIISLLACGLMAQAHQVLDLHTLQVASDSVSATPVMKVENVDGGVRVTYQFNYVYVDSATTDGRTTYTYSIEDFGLAHEAGVPALPGRMDAIALSGDGDVSVELEHMEWVTLSRELTPATPPVPMSAEIAPEPATPITTTGLFPEQPVRLVDVQVLRGTRVGYVAVNPIAYIHEETTVRLATELTYVVRSAATAGSGRAKARALVAEEPEARDAMVNRLVINPLSVDEEEPASKLVTADYLIISVPKYKAAIDEFALWKRRLGYRVHVSYRDKWDDHTIVNDSIDKYYYNTPNLQYLLLVGNADDVPGYISTLHLGTKLYDTHLTDYYYGSPSHNHSFSTFPDIYVGRIPVYTLDDTYGALHKIIDYEACDMDYDMDIFHRSLHCANFADEERDSKGEYVNAPDGKECRKFVWDSEEIRSKMSKIGIHAERVYYAELYDMMKPAFYSNGLPLPEELLSDDFNWFGNVNDIEKVLDSGAMYMLYQGHGSEFGWEYPKYTNAHIRQEDRGVYSSAKGRKSWLHPIIYSITCLTGRYEDKRCFATAALNNPNGGASGVFGASDVSYTPYSEWMLDGMVDSFMPKSSNEGYLQTRLGEVLYQGLGNMLQRESSFSVGGISVRTMLHSELYHCFGDPSMWVRTMEPSDVSRRVDVEFDDSGKCHVKQWDSQPVYISFYDGENGQVECYRGTAAEFQFAPANGVDRLTETIAHQTVTISGPDMPVITKYRKNPGYIGSMAKFETPGASGHNLILNYSKDSSVKSLAVVATSVSNSSIVYKYQCDIASDALAIDVSKWPSDVFVFNLVANGFIVDTLKFNPVIFVRFSPIQ